MAACSRSLPTRRRWFFTLSLVATVGVIAVGLLLWQAVGLGSLAVVSERVGQVRPYLSGLRFALIGLLALAWPRLPALWWGGRDWAESQRSRWMALRWRVVGWLLVIELVLGQNVVLGAQCDACSAPVGTAPGTAQINLIGRFLGTISGLVP
ncbi:MAG: hypothetical protein U5S82_15410 [Gammaproteobacteria bacterium]|nr:hypothetical protein [Gammaproteobacteria bacterium]